MRPSAVATAPRHGELAAPAVGGGQKHGRMAADLDGGRDAGGFVAHLVETDKALSPNVVRAVTAVSSTKGLPSRCP